MRPFSLIYPLAVVASVYADCSGLESGSTDTVTGGFKLVAYNDAAGTTTPLNFLNAYTVPMASYEVFSTGTGSSGGFSGFTLSNGVLTATPTQYLAPANFIGLEAPPSPTALYPVPAPWLLFSNVGASPDAFCSVPNPTGDNVLALNGFIDQFSLCESSFSQTLPDTNALLFNASLTAQRDDWNTYDGSTCTPVIVLLVPLSS